ncbi:serine/threonine-protein kinase [Hyalangium rubrum]|uniref:Serine/threonine-protein kinase n=1 Tax=Hyalangium rubrum TaxID=3103134 RepID=A0ABU5HE68_9BACT|nr:serine/threonine-protein kinase [Hyalangium sp. s54d21]MDY7230395.1 serine/threonine-protein kinase [Hyalangium sp. s54d21]
MGGPTDEVETRCLGENTLDGLSRGLLSPGEREAAVRHLDACDACRQLLAALGHAISGHEVATPPTATDTGPRKLAPRLAAGDRVGRYTVLHLVGAGGMGVVYAAYDPELDRRIALKLVHDEALPSDSREEAAARLLREAQALARLSHPHVITVFDGGRFDGQVFLAMEFIEGGTLGQWLQAAPRTADAVLAMFLDAGRGLAAAHSAGLVHRDFKPDNVLVGKDGRVRVTDFGLARLASSGVQPLGEGAALPRALPAGAEARTQPGARLGTPLYMAPELWRGAPADARSDQFAFCVALYEAIQGERPFTVTELAEESARTEQRELPRGNRVPPRWRQILVRGLAAAPEARFPSMVALLAALERTQTSQRRRRFQVGASLGVVALIAAGLGLVSWRYRSQNVCAGARERLEGTWDEARKSEVRAAFHATGSRHAEAAWSGAELLMDRYANNWVQMRTDACEATHVRGEQSGELLDLRMECLGRRRAALSGLARVLSAADTGVVERAVSAAGQLPPIEECASKEALTAPLRPPPDEATRTRLRAVRAQLVEAKALLAAGRHEPSRALAQEAIETSKALAYKPVEAEAFLALAHTYVRSEEGALAEKALHGALMAAEASAHRTVAAQTSLLLAHVHGQMLRRNEQGRLWADLGGAMLERLGQVPALSAERLFIMGNLLLDEGRASEAAPFFEEALVLQERAHGSEHPQVARTLSRLASTMATLDRSAEALTYAQRALAINERLLGPEHPDCSASLHSIAFVLAISGRPDEALPHMKRALAIEERAFGPNHPAIVKSLINLSNVHREAADAIPLLERALAIQNQVPDVNHPDRVFILKNLAINHGLLDHFREQLEYGQLALSIEEKLLGPNHADVAQTLHMVGQAHQRLGAPARALPLLERAFAIAEARPLTDSYSTGRDVRVELRKTLANTLWTLGRERARARTLMAGALELARGGGSTLAQEAAGLEKWLAEHPLPH